MLLSVHLTSTTAEASGSGVQVVNAIAGAIAEIAPSGLPSDQADLFTICLALSHPLAGRASPSATARFAKASRTITASASVDYIKWINENWAARLDALRDALIAAVGAVSNTRMSSQEREFAFGLLDRAVALTKELHPTVLIPLRPVYLTFYPESDEPSINFDGTSVTDMNVVELKPSDLSEYLQTHPLQAPAQPSMFKLYHRVDERLFFHEAWIVGERIIEHWGSCGEPGDTRHHDVAHGTDPFATLKSLQREPRAKGYRPIRMSRHVGVVVERQIEGMGSPSDLEQRHALQTFLDDKLGWNGIGHCDGGSMGQGSMEAFCLVVDGPIALEVLGRELARSQFRGFRARVESQGL